MTTTAPQTLLPIANPYFAKGYRLGRLWYFSGWPDLPIDDTYLIENIANYCERGMHENIEWLSERVGFLMGMVSGNILPEEGKDAR